MMESIGKRIASYRLEHGWTQQEMADRLALSRVAVSHMEMDLTIPSERTITLLAGLFKVTPHDLVAGTTYPRAKAERLPEFTCSYTELEMELALLSNDLEWLARIEPNHNRGGIVQMLWDKWSPRLEHWEGAWLNERERNSLTEARRALIRACRSG